MDRIGQFGRREFIYGAGALAAAGGLLAACGDDDESSAPPPPDEMQTVSIELDFLPNLIDSWLWVGEAAGYFEAQGIILDRRIPGADLTLKPKLLGEGEFDMSFLDTPSLIFARANDIDLIAVGTLFAQYGAGLIFNADRGYTGPADMDGLVLANFNALDWKAFMRTFLADGGLSTDDVTIVDPAFNSVAAISEGLADAADGLFYGERVSLSLLEGATPGWISYTDHGVPDVPFYNLAVRADWAEDNEDLVKRFLVATGQSLKKYLTDPAAAEAAFVACCTEGATATGTLESTTAKYNAAIPFFLPPGAGDPADATYLELDDSNMQSVLDWSVDSGLAETVDSPSDYFVSDFLTSDATEPSI